MISGRLLCWVLILSAACLVLLCRTRRKRLRAPFPAREPRTTWNYLMSKNPYGRSAAILAILSVIILAAACSNGTKVAPTKAEVTLDSNLYSIEHPELFNLVRVEARDLPTVLRANGTVTPDVNRTIHVTSPGSGRVVDLRVRLGDSVKRGQDLLSIYSADLAGAFNNNYPVLRTASGGA